MKKRSIQIPLSIIIACLLGLLTAIHTVRADDFSGEETVTYEQAYEKALYETKNDVRQEVIAEYSHKSNELYGLDEALDSFEAQELLEEIARAEASSIN